MRKALVVLSGGQDSTICLYWAKANFDLVTAISFDYGQKHSRELHSATMIALMANVNHHIIPVRGILDGRSPLTNPSEELETYTDAKEMEEIIGDRVELTFVPMRNSLFLTIAANRAVCHDIGHIITGVCQADNANYPDCRDLFIESQQKTINEALGLIDPSFHYGSLGKRDLNGFTTINGKIITDYEFNGKDGGIYIHAPLMNASKETAIERCLQFPGCYVALAYSHTAYSGEYPPITQDHATVLRADGFRKAMIPDPLIVRAAWERLIPMPTGTEMGDAANYDFWHLEGPPAHAARNPQTIDECLVELEGRLRDFLNKNGGTPVTMPL